MTEAQVSQAVKLALSAMGADWWSSEVGYVLDTDPLTGKARPRRGGTRTTPGLPDLLVHLPAARRGSGWRLATVEVKGAQTKVTEEQWEYAQRAAERGLPHLIVRSPDELYRGLAYLRLLPNRFHMLSGQLWDRRQWPLNMNYLPVTADAMGVAALTIPANKRRQPVLVRHG